MWRGAALSAGRTCFCSEFRSGGEKAVWGFRAMHTSIPPTFPADRLTALQAMNFWRQEFEDRGIPEPELCSRHITAHLLGAKTMEGLEQERLTEFLSPEKMRHLWKLCSRRLSRMPVQYVIEEWDFRDLTLKLRPPVFIPRPETEELVDLVLADLQKQSEGGEAASGEQTVLEVGCGSGAISLSLLKSSPQVKVVALDRSRDAVGLTRENAHRLGLQERLQVYHMDIMKDVSDLSSLCGSVSALVSNPPYLFSEDMLTLEPEILRFEDSAALDGGEDGLSVIKQILAVAPRVLSNCGRVYLEVDPRHPPVIQQWVEVNVDELQFSDTISDFCGRPRFCILQKEKAKPGRQTGSGLRR